MEKDEAIAEPKRINPEVYKITSRKFINEIVVDRKPEYTYFHCNKFDRKNIRVQVRYWNEVIVHDAENYSIRDILNELTKMMDRYDFHPVGARHTNMVGKKSKRKFDLSFLIRLNALAVDHLFDNNLEVTMPLHLSPDFKTKKLNMTIIFSVAIYQSFEIYVLPCITDALTNAFTKMESDEINGVHYLDFSEFWNTYGSDIFINLANENSMRLFTERTIQLQRKLSKFRKKCGLRMKSNNLYRLESLKHLCRSLNIKYLDLQNNDIENFSEVKQLQSLNLTELNLSGNPVLDCEDFVEQMTHYFPNVMKTHVLTPKHSYFKTQFCKADRTQTEKSSTVTPVVTRPSVQIARVAPRSATKDNDMIVDPEPSPPNFTVTIDLTSERLPIVEKVKSKNVVSTSSLNLEANNDPSDDTPVDEQHITTKWHRVVINHNGKASKDDLLDAINRIVENHKFIPTNYLIHSEFDEFMVHESSEAIELLMQKKLQILVGDERIPIAVNLNVRDFISGDLDYEQELQKILVSRCLKIPPTMNLEDIASCPLMKPFSVKLSHTYTLQEIIRSIELNYSDLRVLVLKNNGLTSVKGLHRLVWMDRLKILDLSNNRLTDFRQFLDDCPSIDDLAEIDLRGNPWSIAFLNSNQYVAELKTLFPNLKMLDGYTIPENDSFLIWNQNFVCDLLYYDFVERFLKKYYEIYDSLNRQVIHDFYHPQAFFSMSMVFQLAKITIENSGRVNRHNTRSRNLLDVGTKDQPLTNLYVSQDTITKFLCEMPKTVHDFQTFSIDVTIATDSMICMTISGLFKEMMIGLQSNTEFWLGFTRTFVLRQYKTECGLFQCATDYRICNDQLSLFSLTDDQIECGFLTPISKKREPLTATEKRHIVKLFQELTNMKATWSAKCLTKTNWILTVALENFTRLHMLNKIPDTAFMTE